MGLCPFPSPPLPHSQLIKMMLIMVKMKKGRGSMVTFTMTAVIKNTSPMATRLPKIRICWGILQERVSVRKTHLPKACESGAKLSHGNPSQTPAQEPSVLPLTLLNRLWLGSVLGQEGGLELGGPVGAGRGKEGARLTAGG